MADSDDSDAPEEFTAQQSIQIDDEIRKAQKETKSRVARERKERQRMWAQRKTPRSSKANKESTESEPHEEDVSEEEVVVKNGMLPNDIVNLLAAREKQTFSSDSEEEKIDKRTVARKKKRNNSGAGPVILNEVSSSHCLQNSLEFLKKRKMLVARSTAVLENSGQALRLISSSGLLGKK